MQDTMTGTWKRFGKAMMGMGMSVMTRKDAMGSKESKEERFATMMIGTWKLGGRGRLSGSWYVYLPGYVERSQKPDARLVGPANGHYDPFARHRPYPRHRIRS